MSNTVRILLIALAAIAAIALCAVAAVLLINLLGSSSEATPTDAVVEGGTATLTEAPSPTPAVAASSTSTAAASATPPLTDDSWERIKAKGQIVVGTAADYPPFEYYVDGAQIDGFDVALMDEIGRRLGVAVEYRDMAFDALGSALELQQINVAMAAISMGVSGDRSQPVEST